MVLVSPLAPHRCTSTRTAPRRCISRHQSLVFARCSLTFDRPSTSFSGFRAHRHRVNRLCRFRRFHRLGSRGLHRTLAPSILRFLDGEGAGARRSMMTRRRSHRGHDYPIAVFVVVYAQADFRINDRWTPWCAMELTTGGLACPGRCTRRNLLDGIDRVTVVSVSLLLARFLAYGDSHFGDF